MIQLYDLNHNKLYGLTNYKDLKRECTLDGEEILSFLYPQADPKYSSIEQECYIRTIYNEYVIKEINVDDDWTEFICKVNIEAIKGVVIPSFNSAGQNCADTVNLALAGTAWTIGSCDVAKNRTVKKSNCSSYEVLREIRDIYKCDFRFDAINKKIYIYQSMGYDKGAYFTDELNLRAIKVQSNSYDFCTRLIPVGKDGLNISKVNGGKEYVENYQYSNKVITVLWEDNRYSDEEILKEDAELRLNELSKPMKAYSADIIDLAKLNDKYSNILDYDLGDTITLVSGEKNVNDKQRIIKIVQYLEEPERNSCEIANRLVSLEDLQTEFEDTSNVVDTITTADGMIDSSKVDFNPQKVEVNELTAKNADIGELKAETGNVGTLTATKANITDLTATTGIIEKLETKDATIENLNASNVKVKTLEGQTLDIGDILAKSVFAELAKFGQITAESAIIAKSAISAAQIISLEAHQLTTGTIDTTNISLAGANNRLVISGNKLQVFDDKVDLTLYERICIGDVNGDASKFGMRIRGSDGTTLLFDENGQTKEGFTDGYNKLEGNSLDPAKIDIAKVIRRINDDKTETIKSSRVLMDSESLESTFKNLVNSVVNGEKYYDQKTKISQTADAVDIVAGSLQDLKDASGKSSFSDIGASIGATSDSITSKVWSKDIISAIDAVQVGGINLLKNSRLDYIPSSISGTGTINEIVLDPVHGNVLHTNRQFVYGGELSLSTPLDANIDITFSFFAKSLSGKALSFQFNDGAAVVYPSVVIGTSWGLYKVTAKTVKSCLSGVKLYLYCSGEFWIKNIKVEKGNVSTDWSPAPEDTQSQIDTINSQVSDMSNDNKLYSSEKQILKKDLDSFTQEKSALDNQANTYSITTEKTNYDTSYTTLYNYLNPLLADLSSTSDVDGSKLRGYFSDYFSKRTVLQNKITDKAKDLAVSAAATDTSNKINAVQVGGRNLIKNSNFSLTIDSSNWLNVSAPWTLVTTKYLGNNYMSCDNSAAVSGYKDITQIINNVKPNTQYTVSFYLSGRGEQKFAWFGIEKLADGATNTAVYNDHSYFITSTSTWTKYTKSFITQTDCSTIVFVCRCYFGGSANVTMIKLEEGTKATDWTPANEDVQSKIDSGINGIQIGGRNLIKNTSKAVSKQGAGWVATNWFLSDNLVSGTYLLRFKYTCSVADPIGISLGIDGVYDGTYEVTATLPVGTNVYYSTPITFTRGSQNTLCIYTNQEITISELKLESGSRYTDWTPAPEEVQSQIDTTVTRIYTAEQQITPDGITNKFVNSLDDGKSVESGVIKLNKTGIEVSHSNVGTKTVMNADGFRILNPSGESIGSLAEQSGLSILNANRIFANNIDTVDVTPRSYYVKGTTGNDNNNGTSSSPFRTVKKALDVLAANGKIRAAGADINLYIYETISENILIRNFIGGKMLIFLDRNCIINGQIDIEYCSSFIDISGGRTGISDSGGALIRNQQKDSTCIDILGCSFVYIRDLRISNNGGYGVVFNASRGFISGCDLNYCNSSPWASCVRVGYAGQAGIGSCCGSNNYLLGTASNGATLICGEQYNGTVTTVPYPGNFWADAGANVVLYGTRTNTNSSYTYTPPATQIYTKTWGATSTKSWRDSYGWRSDNNYVYQGSYGYGNHKGFICFDSGNIRSNLSGATIYDVQLHLRRQSAGGNSASQNVHLWGHSYTSLGGGYGLINDYGIIGSWSWGEDKWVSLPINVARDLQLGTIQGLAIFENNGSPYVICDGFAELWIKYEK